MNTTLMTTFWRQRATSAVRMAIVALATGMPLLILVFMPGAGLSVLGNAQGLVLAIGAGMIGQDVSSGVLQLLCARPVRRPDYVLSRWLAVGLGGAAISVVQVGLAAAVLAARGAPSVPQQIVLFGAGRIFECIGLAAVMALLSSLIGGFGDLALYLIGGVVFGLIQMIGQFKHWLWLDRVGSVLQASLTPTLDLPRLISATPMPWSPIFSYLSVVALCLALAILVVNRKELSYASG